MARIWVLILLLAATLGLIERRGNTDRVPPSTPLAQLPPTLGPWHAQELPIAPAVLEILGEGIFLNRLYEPDTMTQPAAQPAAAAPTLPVALFIGYFPTQRSGQSIHSPQNCLPGAGWSFESSGITEWKDDAQVYKVGDYLISNGTDRQEVLYWYRSHGHNIANDYLAKFYMLRDSILYGRTDAALIRISTPIARGETQASAHARVMQFAHLLTPRLSAYIPD